MVKINKDRNFEVINNKKKIIVVDEEVFSNKRNRDVVL